MENWRVGSRNFHERPDERTTENWRSGSMEGSKGNEETGKNWRSGSNTTDRKFLTRSSEQNGSNFRSNVSQRTGIQQNHRGRPAISSNTRAQFKTDIRSSNSGRKATSNKMHAYDLSKLEAFLDENPRDFVSRLLCQSTWFSQFVDSVSDLSFDCIVLIVRILARLSECSLDANTSEILKVASADLFLVQLKNFILVLPHQSERDQKGARYFWQDANDFFENLHKYFEMVLSLSPSVANDMLPALMGIIHITLPQLSVLSEETNELFKTLQDRLAEYLAERNLQYSKKDKKIHESELEPPDNFRCISLHPLLIEITNRQKAFVRPNIVVGPYRNIDHYLDVQFRLLREDFVKPLREGICDYLDNNNNKLQNIRIYKNVKLLGPTICANNGTCGQLIQLEIKDKAKYKQKIQNSRRFMFGSLVCFTSNNFNSVIFGKIIGRDLPLLSKGQMIVELESDGNVEYRANWLMVESNMFFEPYYRVLQVLQSLHEASFPMKQHLVDVSTEIDTPFYPECRNNGLFECCCRSFPLFVEREFSDDEDEIDEDYKIYPQLVIRNPKSYDKRKLNEAQLEAFESSMSRRLCVIQGPPGTGKTHLGLTVAKALLERRSKWYHGRYPLLVVCFTNHALDQFLEGLLPVTNRVVRIGGQSKNVNLEKYNIKNLRRDCRRRKSKAFYEARSCLQCIHRDVQQLHRDVETANSFRGIVNILSHLRKLPELHGTPFEEMTKHQFSNWLLEEQNHFQSRQNFQAMQVQQINMYLEESDVELLNIAEDPNEQHNVILDDIFTTNIQISPSSVFIISIDDIYQQLQPLLRRKIELEEYNEIFYESICQIQMEINSVEGTLEYLQMRLEEGKHITEFHQTAQIDFCDPLSIHPNDRWALYFYWLELYVADKMETIAIRQAQYQVYYESYEKLRAVEDVNLMSDNLVVGMTTTSAARLRESLRVLRSPIVIVEEAAEIVESHVVASVTEHCGHLILIGDHQQLRPSTADYTMEKKYNLGISLFERLIKNDMPCNVLNVQHRMRPEIAKLIAPSIYPKLENHESVYRFPTVRGVQTSLYFISHTNPEQRCLDESKSNLHEAEYLLHLARYLLLNGYESEDVTILAAYSGQMLLLKNESVKYKILRDVRITVLDNYQGEESKIILLSLVRNNDEGKIGFLSIDNRVCVALSRARQGLYIMGNMDMLCARSDLWKKIRSELEEQKSLGTSLPLRCENHSKVTNITNISDFSKVPWGGCDVNCEELLICGHRCTLTCHMFDRDHSEFKCEKMCTKVLCEREHVCPKLCYQKCGSCMVLVTRTLECGHEMEYPCSENTPKCQYPVSAELPCKHKIDNKPCYRDVETYPCPFPCGARLDKCGHACNLRCHINNDPDHLQVKCYKECLKYRKNCTMDAEKHKCPLLCHEECPVCEVKIRKERSCSHFYDLPCFDDVEKVVCKKPCKKTLPCGHVCKLKCYEACGNCTEKANKVVPNCGHNVFIPCTKEPTKSDCKQDCQMVLPCGHQCDKKCSENCTTKCALLVDSVDPLICGHQAKIPCHANNADGVKQENVVVYCKQACSAQLECGHMCSGSCGSCYQGRIHQICNEMCTADLICGHKCTGRCNQPCHPCTMQQCIYRCPHVVCKHKCGAPCKPCRSRCTRRCVHIKCSNQCGLTCSVPPCEEVCEKILTCGHKCIGFCGEPCPPLCMTCNKEELLAFTMGHEENEDARFVLLQECKHVVESKGMESWLAADHVGVKKCPQCLIPLTITKRYSEYIADSKNDIYLAKSAFFGNDTSRRSLQNSLYKRLEENERSMASFSRVSKAYAYTRKQIQKDLKQGPRSHTISYISGKIIQSKIQILENICNLLKSSLYQTRTNKCVQYIDFLLRRLTLHPNRMTEQEINDYMTEMKRLRRILQLEDLKQACPFTIETHLYKTLNDKLYSLLRYDVNSDEANERDLRQLCEDVGGDTSIIKDVELQAIEKAVGVKC